MGVLIINHIEKGGATVVTIGRCPYCYVAEKIRTDHHITPRRFTSEKKKEVDRLDMLFPECFAKGEKEEIVSVCRSCHRKADRLIPHSLLMTPDKYYLLHEKLSAGEVVSSNMVIEWVEESYLEVRKRRRAILLGRKKCFKILFWMLSVLLMQDNIRRRAQGC